MSGFFAMEFSISTHLPLSYYAVMNEESQIEVRSAPGLIGVDGEHVQAKAVKIVGAVGRFVVVAQASLLKRLFM